MIDDDETLVRIEAPHFVAGVVLKGDKVILTAPIVAYMRGWSADRLRKYYKEKGWQAFIVKNPNPEIIA